jgi:hypothetical protein
MHNVNASKAITVNFFELEHEEIFKELLLNNFHGKNMKRLR